MTNIEITKLTENSSMIYREAQPIGIKLLKGDKCMFISPLERITFDSVDELNTFLQDKDADMELKRYDIASMGEIDGYPVKHTGYAEVEANHPAYTKSNVRYLAGYWAIKFSKQWAQSYCPPEKTVNNYESSGPFRTRLELLTFLEEKES